MSHKKRRSSPLRSNGGASIPALHDALPRCDGLAAFPFRPHSEPCLGHHGLVRLTKRDLLPLLAVPLAWASIVAVVAAVEFASERHKYNHGAYTDTFDPLGITRVLALPLSGVMDALVPEGSPPEGLPHLALRAGLLVIAAFVNVLLLLALGLAVLLTGRWLWVRLRSSARAL
jgi:hypothetical protein